MVKNLLANTGDTRDSGSIPGSGRSTDIGNGNSLPYYCLKNSMDKRSLAGCSSWICKEWDTTEHTHNEHIKHHGKEYKK